MLYIRYSKHTNTHCICLTFDIVNILIHTIYDSHPLQYTIPHTHIRTYSLEAAQITALDTDSGALIAYASLDRKIRFISPYTGEVKTPIIM